MCSERVLISEAAVLDQLSLKGLKKLCNSFGVDTTGSQADLVDRATAHCLVKIESILEPAVDFDALLDMAGQAVLDSAPAEEAAVEPAMPCTRTKSCTCPLCDAGYAALAEVLGEECGLVRGLYFDKPPDQSWSLPWHRDQTIAVADNRLPTTYFRNPTKKEGVLHVEAPRELLQQMLTLRIHLIASLR